MRGADERLQIDLARDLIFRGDLVFRQQGPATADYVTAAWHNFVYGDRQGGAVLLVRSVARARRALLQTLCAAGERVLLPANATYTLVESVKRAAVPFCFGGLDAHLHLLLPQPVRVAWGHWLKLWQKPLAESCPSCAAKFLVLTAGKTPMIKCLTEGCGYEREPAEAAASAEAEPGSTAGAA